MKTNEEIAREVIDGKWSNGDERIVNLTNAGYNASIIQKIVNQMLKEKMVTDVPETTISEKPDVKYEGSKQILEITVDLRKHGALILNFIGD